MGKRKHKAPQMPAWFWYGIVDGCWCCKNRHNCNQCKEVRKYRKQHFPPKEKSRHGKADHDGANALALFVFAQIQQDADKCQHRTERSGFEHLDEQAVALQAGKA